MLVTFLVRLAKKVPENKFNENNSHKKFPKSSFLNNSRKKVPEKVLSRRSDH
jgi:hypothetical protein